MSVILQFFVVIGLRCLYQCSPPLASNRWKNNDSFTFGSLHRDYPGFKTKSKSSRIPFSTKMVNDDNISLDPYKILDIPVGTTDKMVIKRAYKRMAMKYHPDVISNTDANGKQSANDRFIKINAAYELLSGKTAAQNGQSGPSSTKTSTSSGYQPPHRRRSASWQSSSTSSNTSSENWIDYNSKYSGKKEEEYDADGDSFGSIFADLLSGLGGAAAGYVGGGKGLITDLVDFLEGNFPEYGAFVAGEVDVALDTILQSNDVALVRNEVDDTSLLIQQLTTKLSKLDKEIHQLELENASLANFSQREKKEEELASLKGRKRVVEDYLKRGRKRLVQLQKRFVSLRGDRQAASSNSDSSSSKPRAAEDRNYYSSSASARFEHGTSNSHNESSSSSSNTRSDKTQGKPSSATSSDSPNSATTQRDSFGSFGRGRSHPNRKSWSAPDRPTYNTDSSAKSSLAKAQGSDSQSPDTTSQKIPPHRLLGNSSWTRQQEDKKRLRDLKIDDEFERLKRELGF